MPATSVRVLGGDQHRGRGAHAAAEEHGGAAAEVVDQRERVAGQRDVVVGVEAVVAVAVAAQVHGGDPVAGVEEGGHGEAEHRAQVAHARQAHDERPVPLDVVGDPALAPVEVASFHSSKANPISQSCQPARQSGTSSVPGPKVICVFPEPSGAIV